MTCFGTKKKKKHLFPTTHPTTLCRDFLDHSQKTPTRPQFVRVQTTPEEQKKGRSPTTSPMTTHSPWIPPPGDKESFMYPHELFCRDEHRILVRSADHKKGGSLTSLLRAVHSRVRNEKSFMYPYELFCKDGHETAGKY